MSERRTKELANIEKLEATDITLQEARVQATEIVYARWLDDVARRVPEETAATKSSDDATQDNAPDHEDEVQATTPITASRIALSMAVTKVIVKERHCTASVDWRSMTAWYGHETDKCWGEVKNILMGELVIGVPNDFRLEGPWVLGCALRIIFLSNASIATSIKCVRTAHFDTKIMPPIKPMWFGGEMTGKQNSCREMTWSLPRKLC